MHHFDTPAESRKKAKEAARKILDDRDRAIRHQLYENRYNMAKLVNQQSALKRELAELTALRRALNPKPAPQA